MKRRQGGQVNEGEARVIVFVRRRQVNEDYENSEAKKDLKAS